MVKVKVCGITNLDDATQAAEAGYDAVGFVFYKNSQRYITPQSAKKIIKNLPPHVIKIGVFVNAREGTVRRIAKLCSLDLLQFHGNESPEFCARFNKKYKVIKAFRVKNKIDEKNVLRYRTFAYLFDTFVPTKLGGTGKKFDWKLVRHIDAMKRPIFLSGGLNIENVKDAVDIVRPHWVDVSSAVEIRPGKKDHKKLREFIKTVKIGS